MRTKDEAINSIKDEGYHLVFHGDKGKEPLLVPVRLGVRRDGRLKRAVSYIIRTAQRAGNAQRFCVVVQYSKKGGAKRMDMLAKTPKVCA